MVAFFSTRIVMAKPIAIATIMPATAGTKYMSAIDAGASVGAGVVLLDLAVNDVSANDG